ncbi:chromate transporter [Bacillus methanolicus]|uniref:Chromate transporter n=1 Tax=Bacillus methanolicus (strain MGA3 / ATCC 53907) TaxID=796606 RepID=I3EAY7_BACMM|nr:chromate transporter [Bacillus methanolicus]AIE61345.1 chromate transporter [Bacillus methanolicus MGA3]EIJ83658.1 chromate transporter [Bacillus methanolicus MGA3]
MKQLDIFLAFFRVGMLGYGGGPSAIPLVHKEVVDKYKWMDSDEFGDIVALGNALPGPIATKLAGYIGYRVGGMIGMLNALVASTVPTIILMILLLNVLNAYKDQPWVKGMAAAVIPVVAAMLAALTWEYIKKSWESTLGWVWTLLFVIGSLILMEFINIHPAIIIFASLLGALLKKDSRSSDKGNKEKSSI